MNSSKYVVRSESLLYSELSFKVNGILFDVFKQLGGGHLEKYYQKAVRIGLEYNDISFEEQYYAPLKYKEEVVGKYFLDFLIEDKIVLELKRDQFIPANIIHQTKQYLVTLDLELAILGCFTHKGVIIKRIINQK